MNVYIIPAWYPQNEQDIVASFFREQANALAERGHDVTVIHIDPLSVTNLFRKPWRSKRIWQDGKVRTVLYKAIVPVLGKFADIQEKYISNLYYSIIRKQIEEDKNAGLGTPDILHAHVSHSCGYYCLKAAEKLNLPLVVTEHYSGLLLGTATKREYGRVKETIEKSDAFIFVGSNFQKSLCEKLNITKPTYFVPNMVDNFFFEEEPLKEKESESFKFLSACHLKENKSVNLVINAFHKAFGEEEPIKLVIAGDGEQLGELKSLVDALDEKGRISFFGKYSREQGRELFSASDAFVLTSKVETFGIVYIEALASGTPCIATSGQGGDDIINDFNGFLVEYGNESQLCAAMRKLYENRSSYDKKAIKEDCKARFSDDAVCQRIEEIYKKFLAEGEEKQ